MIEQDIFQAAGVYEKSTGNKDWDNLSKQTQTWWVRRVQLEQAKADLRVMEEYMLMVK